MRYYGGIFTIATLAIILAGQSTFAQEKETNDCGTTIKTVNQTYVYSNISPTILTTIAQQNLKTYCCRYYKEVLDSNKIDICKSNISDYYVDSPWLYDHLIDVGMRYLDGDKTLQYTEDNNIPLDTKGEERRTFVTEYGDSPTGKIPLELQNKYTEYRGTMIEDFDILQSSESCEQRQAKFQEYNANRDTLSLAKKYFILCEISSCMVDGKKNNRISTCQSLVSNRINQERNYVQGLLLHQSTLALATNFDAYALGYITHDKFSQLLEKIVMMAKGLGFVNSKVNEMTKMCSA